MDPQLERLAGRVANDPLFLAAALTRYAQSEGLDDPALAAALGCAVATLTPLRLCRMPRPEAPLFRQDVEQIAARFGVMPDLLAEVVRRGQSLLHLQDPANRTRDEPAGFLLAARDRPADGPEAGKGGSP